MKINKIENTTHYQKINILGDSGVGKTSLISLMENYNDDDYEIMSDNLNTYKMRTESEVFSYSIVEEIKRVTIPINENKKLYFNLYETNLNNYDFIKSNLDILLLQTECIIIMWDVSKSDTYDNIPDLIKIINEEIKNNKFRDVPIFIIQNKNDLNLTCSQKFELNDNRDSTKEIKEINKNIIYKEISLLEKNLFFDLISDIDEKINIYKEKQEKTKDVVYLVKFNIEPNQLKNNIDKNNDNNFLNIILLGYTSIGKTTFFKYFLGKNNISTKGIDSLIINAEIDKEKVKFNLFDIPGKEKIDKNYIRNSNGILLFFDVTNSDSFKSVDQSISNIKKIKDESKYEIILIGNKIDITDKRVIKKEEAKEKAIQYKIKYFEISCLNGLNVYEIMNEIILSIYDKCYEDIKYKEQKIDSIIIEDEENEEKTKQIEKKKFCCHCCNIS